MSHVKRNPLVVQKQFTGENWLLRPQTDPHFFPPRKNNVYKYFVFSHKEFRTWGKCCFTWSIVQTCRLCWYLWFYTFVDLLPIMYKLSKKKIWRWIVFKYCGGFLCVFIKPKIWFIWWRKCLNRWNLFLFFPPFSLRVLCFFFYI